MIPFPTHQHDLRALQNWQDKAMADITVMRIIKSDINHVNKYLRTYMQSLEYSAILTRLCDNGGGE